MRILGVDSGLTETKAVVFDSDGSILGSGRSPARCLYPHSRWVEKDPQEQWHGCARAISAALSRAGARPADIAAVGVTGHGDGLYLVDGKGVPVRPAIPSLDSRAHEIAAGWRRSGVADRVLALSGEAPFAQHAPALLTWLRQEEPATLDRARNLLYAKDWLKLKLTGVLCTDPTEATAGFTGISDRRYSDAVLAAYGLSDLARLLPPVVPSTEVIGKVTAEAAAETGLAEGTPVISGLHDCAATALGAGAAAPGVLTMVAGTYSVNEVVGTEPVSDARWLCRDWITPGRWMHMSTSAASATNLEWFARQLAPSREAVIEDLSGSDDDRADELLFLPFLYGSPHGELASAAFLGVRGWHTRADLVRALIEGVVFNHRTHVDWLASKLPVHEARLAGGGARSPEWSQTFADVLGMPVAVPAAEEAGAHGAAMCAGVALGWYASPEEAAAHAVRVARVHEPAPGGRRRRLEESYETYRMTVDALAPVWERLGAARETEEVLASVSG